MNPCQPSEGRRVLRHRNPKPRGADHRRGNAAEDRHQHRGRQQPARGRTEQRGRRLFADPGGRSELRQRHRPEVDQIHQQIEQTDQHGAADHPQREIPLGALDLAGGEGRLVPPVEVAEDRDQGESHRRQQVSRRQRRGPIHRDVGRRHQAEADQACDRQEFDRRSEIPGPRRPFFAPK